MGRKPCCSKVGLNRGAWTVMEDQILSSYINTHGDGKWRNLPKIAGLKRCGKSCRLRWLNYLRPGIKGGNISLDEEDFIIRLHKLLGNRWSLIAGRLPGRTDNEIKNYWNTTLARKANTQSHSPSPSSSGKIPPKNKRVDKKSSEIDHGSKKSQATRPRVIRAKPVNCTGAATQAGTFIEAQQQGQEDSPPTGFWIQDSLFPQNDSSDGDTDFLGFCSNQVRINEVDIFCSDDDALLMEEKIMSENWTETFCKYENEKLDMNSFTFLLDSSELS